MAQRAEAAGFDSIWLYDHLLYRPDDDEPTVGIWECWTVLSALAEATERVRLGTLVVCTQFRNPALLAKMASTLDEVSQGRFVLGIGAGWNEEEFAAFGYPFDRRVDRFEEAVQIIGPLVREGYVDFEGEFYSARDCEINPRGPSRQGPPILVGTSGPRMMRLTAQHGDIWNVGYLGLPDPLPAKRAAFDDACRVAGRDPADIPTTVLAGLWYSDLSNVKPQVEHVDGAEMDLAEVLEAYAELDVSEIIFQVVPYTADSHDRLAASVAQFRSSSSLP